MLYENQPQLTFLNECAGNENGAANKKAPPFGGAL
jgi:hypothetical protein